MASRTCLLLLAPLGACVSYTPDHADVATVAAEAALREGGSFPAERAFAEALLHNPEVLAAAAEARAAGAVVQPLMIEGEYRSGPEMLAVMLDPVALLGLGPRGGAMSVDAANAERAAVALATTRWRVLVEVAEVFAVDAALASLVVPSLETDAQAFVAAGLAGEVEAARLLANRAAAAVERAHVQHERIAARNMLRDLLGLPATVAVEFDHTNRAANLPEGGDDGMLRRPDLALAEARFRLADAEFRAAVAEQWPSLMLGPELPLLGGAAELMAVLRWPLLAHGRARAAGERREAARAELLDRVVRASNEVDTAVETLHATTMEVHAAAARRRASDAALSAAKIAVEVEIDAFARLAEASTMAVEDARMLREAQVAKARAEIRLAAARGWPRVDGTRKEAR